MIISPLSTKLNFYRVPNRSQPLSTALAGKFHRVPIITGTNRDDGAMFTLDASMQLSPLLYAATILCPAALPVEACVLPPDQFSPAQRAELLSLYPPRGFGLIDGGNARNLQQIYTDRMFTCPSRNLAASISARGVHVFEYMFNSSVGPNSTAPRQDPFARGANETSVTHTNELPFVFLNFDESLSQNPASLRAPTQSNINLGYAIGSYWRALASAGDPNAPGGSNASGARGRPKWPLSKNSSGEQSALLFESPSIVTNATGMCVRARVCVHLNHRSVTK